MENSYISVFYKKKKKKEIKRKLLLKIFENYLNKWKKKRYNY